MGSRPLRVLVAAGPTQEPLDAVRYLGNRSSGRMGLEIAREARDSGCLVTLALGPIPGSEGHSWPGARRFQTAAELLDLLTSLWPEHDCLIMAAAVADFRRAASPGTHAAGAPQGKIRRSAEGLRLDLEATPDILATLAPSTRPDQYVVGFALEAPEELEASARRKLASKRADMIVANPLETMESERVAARLYLADGGECSPLSGAAAIPKRDFAIWFIRELLPRVRAKAGV